MHILHETDPSMIPGTLFASSSPGCRDKSKPGALEKKLNTKERNEFKTMFKMF